MSSIRRVLSGISSSISRARLDVETEPVSPLAPREPLEPVAPVRRGFSDQSDFQAEVDDLDASLLAHAPPLAGYAAPGASGASGASGVSGGPTPQQLRVFSGESSFESSFESASPRYAQRLGSQLPSSLGAPSESSRGGLSGPSGRRGAGGVQDMDDLLSTETAAWELQNLDTSTPSVVEPEDLLFMLDPPGSTSASEPVLELGLEDVFEERGVDAAAYAAAHLPPDFLDPAVRPAGPDEFLADTNDLGDLVPEEPSATDAPLAGVLASLTANPAAAAVPVSAALASQSVEAVVDPMDVELQARPTVELGASESGEPVAVDTFTAAEPAPAPEQKPEG